MARRSGLGKGLEALIPSEATGRRTRRSGRCPISHIRPNAFQPRSHFDEESMSSLAASIKEVGVLQPVLVREVAGRDGELRADRRRTAVAGGPPGRPPDHPGARPGRRRRGQPRAGAGREPPPGGSQRPRRGGRLPAADRRVRPDPRAGGQTGGQEPGHRDQHAAAAAAAGGRPARPGRGDDHRRPRPGPARDARPGPPGGAWSSGSSSEGLDRSGRRGDRPRRGDELRCVPDGRMRKSRATGRPEDQVAADRGAAPAARKLPEPGVLELEELFRPISTPGSRSTFRIGGVVWSWSSPPSRTSSGSTGPWLVTAASRSSRNCQGRFSFSTTCA